MSESYFDSIKNYYVFKYVIDKVSGQPTEYEGEIQGFVKATNSWEALEKSGLDDTNLYGANIIDNLEDYETAIKDERKHLTKISKQLKEMTDERDAERKKFIEERPCPNGCGKLDEKFRCDKCGYGHEQKQLVDDLDTMIKDLKKSGEDTTELEAIRDSLKSDLDD